MTYDAFTDSVETRSLNAIRVVVEFQMSQHHHGTQQEGRWIGLILAGNVGSRAVDGLKNSCPVEANVATGRHAQTTD